MKDRITFTGKAAQEMFETLTGGKPPLSQAPGSAMHGATYHELDEANAKLCAENAALLEVAGWAQAVLTALNVGDIKSGSPLHLKLREVMIAYRAARDEQPNHLLTRRFALII